MVIVSNGKTVLAGDDIDAAIDTIVFLSTINKMKKEDYKTYLTFETCLKAVIEEEPEFINEIKEFAINMSEIFT